jgi:signal peptidase I
VNKDRLYWEEEAPKRSRRLRRLERERKERRAGFTELVLTVVVAFVLVFGLVRPYVAEAYRIPTESMVPTLEVGDRVLANKFIYRFTEPERGDVIVFKSVQGDDQDLIKRVVGVPGDEITVRGGRLFVNGEPQREPYVNKKFPDRSFYAPTTVPKDHIFAMGDNRANSQDSRVFGPVPKENIEGEAFLRFWPPGRIGLL